MSAREEHDMPSTADTPGQVETSWWRWPWWPSSGKREPEPDPQVDPSPSQDQPDPREGFARAQAGAAAAFAAMEARAGEWDRLVMVCVDMADRLRVHDPGLFAVLRRGLEEVGVTLAEVDGERFDRKRHRAVGSEPAGEPGRHMTVAHTQLCGVTDRGRCVRLPAVVVYVEADHGDES